MTISVLVVSYNVRELLLECLRSLPPGTEAIVVDNASSDGSAAAVREELPWAVVDEFPENRGFSAGVNRAAALSHGQTLLILNPDTELPPGVLERMAQSLETQGPGVWAVGFRQVDSEGFYQLATGPRPSLRAELVRQWVQGRLDKRDRRVARMIDRRYSLRRTVPWVAGSALLVRRSAFETVGGFDERFFLYFEDIDFCLRLWKAGGTVVFDPTITLIHHRGASARKEHVHAAAAYRQSQLYYWEKHRGPVVRRIVAWYQRARGVS